MARNTCLFGCVGLAVAAIAMWIVGCSKQEAVLPTSDHADAMSHDHEGMDHADHDESMHADGDVEAAFASLSAEDRALAMKQKVCPVSGEALGSMGTPIKITVKGHDVFVCCAGCVDALKDDPDQYLAKLGLE